MADIFSKQKRSEIMRLVRATGNKSTEERMASILRRHGISGWRRRQPFPGVPDFVFRRHKVAVLVDGCFWHGCPHHFREPSTHQDYWKRKIAKNRASDLAITRRLRRDSWRVIRFWEHNLSNEPRVISRLTALLERAIQRKPKFENAQQCN